MRPRTNRILLRAILLTATAAVIPACSEGAGGGPDPSVEGLFRISSRGGTGTAGNGGSGGDIHVDGDAIGGDIEVYTTGTVNAWADLPVVAPYLGANPRRVTADETWTILSADLIQDVATIQGDSTGVATGLHVAPGVTLTIQPNFDINAASLHNELLDLSFSDSIFVEGAIVVTTKDSAAVGDGLLDDGADLEFHADCIVVAASGSITTTGRTSAGGPNGGSGGSLELYSANALINRGTLSSAGAEDDLGGNGGFVYMGSASSFVFNGGTICSDGGDGSAGNGGSAGDMDFDITSGTGIFNNGSILARGGSGTASGGNGGGMELLTNDPFGVLTHAGITDSSGGSSTGSGTGGNAGDIGMQAYGGSARIAGTILARGGNGGPAAGDGGDGGGYFIYVEDGAINANEVPEELYVGANIDTSGGDGANGGDAGDLYLWPSHGGNARPVGATIVGIIEFDASGGDGTVNGGSGSTYSGVFNDPTTDGFSNLYYGGRIYNEVPFLACGGDGGTGTGGNGGQVWFRAQQTNVNTAPGTGITNTAPIDVSGGAGGTTGGNGGDFRLLYDTPWSRGATLGITNSGALTNRGGDGGTTGGGGGTVRFSESVSIGGAEDFPRGGVVNSGAIDTRGGVGGTNGGSGGYVEIAGNYRIHNSGVINSSGGAGTAGNGGSGASCNLRVETHISSFDADWIEILNTAAVTTSGGTGGISGGNAGNNWWGSAGSLTNSGTLTGTGGTGTVNGGLGAEWYLMADTFLSNIGAVDCGGGTGGTGLGGDAGTLDVLSKRTTNRAALTARGGGATTGSGGDGGTVAVGSSEGPSTLGGSSMDVNGGSGGAGDGTDGRIYVDGVPLSPTASF